MLVLCEKVRDSALGVVESCASKLFEINVLIENGFDDVWSRYEHVARLVDHYCEICHGRGIHCASRARTHHSRYLRDHSRGKNVAKEYLSITAEADNPLLDSSSSRVVNPDDRDSGLEGEIHYFRHLPGEHFSQRASEDCEVVREQVHRSSVNLAIARYNPVAENLLLRHTEVGGLMNHEPVHFHKTAGVHKCDNSLPGGHLSLRMLIFDLVFAATFLRSFPEVAELLREFLHRHGRLELAEEASRIKARKTNSRVQSKSSIGNCQFLLVCLDDDASVRIYSNALSADLTVAGFDNHRVHSMSTVPPPITHNGTFVFQGLIMPFQDSQNRAKRLF